jgi:hypothetical protein
LHVEDIESRRLVFVEALLLVDWTTPNCMLKPLDDLGGRERAAEGIRNQGS